MVLADANNTGWHLWESQAGYDKKPENFLWGLLWPALKKRLIFTFVWLKYFTTNCKEAELFRGIPVGRFLQCVPVQIEDFEQGEV